MENGCRRPPYGDHSPISPGCAAERMRGLHHPFVGAAMLALILSRPNESAWLAHMSLERRISVSCLCRGEEPRPESPVAENRGSRCCLPVVGHSPSSTEVGPRVPQSPRQCITVPANVLICGARHEHPQHQSCSARVCITTGLPRRSGFHPSASAARMAAATSAGVIELGGCSNSLLGCHFSVKTTRVVPGVEASSTAKDSRP